MLLSSDVYSTFRNMCPFEDAGKEVVLNCPTHRVGERMSVIIVIFILFIPVVSSILLYLHNEKNMKKEREKRKT